MHQLGGLDNLMIGGELPNLPMHMSAAMIYDTGGKRGADRLCKNIPIDFQELIADQFPILRCRVEELPLQLDKAYWVEDDNFSLAYHIDRVALPKPCNWQALYQLLGHFHAQPLDLARPLWQVLVVEGLDKLDGIPSGSTALFLKIHHAMVDGKSALRLVKSLHTESPQEGSPSLIEFGADQIPINMDFKAPSWWSKYGRAWWHSIERPLDMAGTVAKLLPQLLTDDDSSEKVAKRATPRVYFNHPVGPDRVIGHVRMELKALRTLEKKHHCTINDIALCVVAGALRHHLLDGESLPDEDLQTLMPIDVRSKNEDGRTGNHVSMAKRSLFTGIEDSAERLQTIRDDSAKGRKRRAKGDSHALLKLVDEIHPAVILWLGQWLISSGHLDDLPATVNTVVTNVPGMAQEAYLSGAKLIDYLGFGPLAPSTGLFHTVSSTEDHVNVSFLSTAEFMGDGSAYSAALAQSYSELLE
jgi:diacylglycerol O-acyltransferase